MSFLQPFILWGLPLVLVPVIIHLLNRMRYRTLPWAAMLFLLAASRQATRQARVREWLILACRILAVLALLLFLARPLVGGWLGWAVSHEPETVLVLLDRSPSMEAQDAQNHISKRELALRRLAEAGHDAGSSTRYVLLDSATRRPQEFSNLVGLKDLAVAGPSDAAADWPSLLNAALDYIQANQCGRTEIWICSDLQTTHWQPTASLWGTVRERFKLLANDTRVRLLALTPPVAENRAVRITEVHRQRTSKGFELQITIEVTGQNAASGKIPLKIVHEGAESQVEVDFGGSISVRQRQLAGAGLNCRQMQTRAIIARILFIPKTCGRGR